MKLTVQKILGSNTGKLAAAAAIGAAVGYGIYFMRDVPQAIFLCMVGAVAYEWAEIKKGPQEE